jgi:hypothetical protein
MSRSISEYCAPAFLDVLLRDWPVDLVEVDRVDPESLQAITGLAQDRVAFEAVHDPAVGAFQQRAFGEQVRALGEPLQCTADDLFGAAEAVGGGGVDPVDPVLQRVVDRRDRLVIVLGTPAELPAPASDRLGSEAELGYLEAGLPEPPGCDLCRGHVDLFRLWV